MHLRLFRPDNVAVQKKGYVSESIKQIQVNPSCPPARSPARPPNRPPARPPDRPFARSPVRPPARPRRGPLAAQTVVQKITTDFNEKWSQDHITLQLAVVKICNVMCSANSKFKIPWSSPCSTELLIFICLYHITTKRPSPGRRFPSSADPRGVLD